MRCVPSGAALALDEHRCVGAGHGADALHHVAHRRALADHAGQPLVVAQLGTQTLVLLQQRTEPAEATEPLDQLRVEEGFLDEVVCPETHGLHGALDRGVRSHHEHLGLWTRGLRRLEHLQPVRAGEPHVGDHAVEAALPKDLEGRLAVGKHHDVEPLGP